MLNCLEDFVLASVLLFMVFRRFGRGSLDDFGSGNFRTQMSNMLREADVFMTNERVSIFRLGSSV